MHTTAKVYDICRLIPHGRVTTYGHIAKLAGHPSHSRLVGQALKFLGDATVPWQRVVSASGAISDRGDGGQGAARQAARLQHEGVAITQGRGGGILTDVRNTGANAKWKVDLVQYGWFPDHVQLDGYDTPHPDSDGSDLTDLSDEDEGGSG
ncbi:Alkyltransferase-like protein 1 [Thecaphora frezii]